MTNHVHAILSSEKDDLSDIIRDLKSHAAKKILQAIPDERESRRSWLLNLFSFAGKNSSKNGNSKFWTNDNHPIYLDTPFAVAFSYALNYTGRLSAGTLALSLNGKS